LLTLQAFRGSHTHENIATAIEESITECCLQDKVHYIVSDNASNMRKAMLFILSPGPHGNIESWITTDSASSDGVLSVEDDDNVLDDASLYDEDITNEEMEGFLPLAGEYILCFAHSLQLVI